APARGASPRESFGKTSRQRTCQEICGVKIPARRYIAHWRRRELVSPLSCPKDGATNRTRGADDGGTNAHSCNGGSGSPAIVPSDPSTLPARGRVWSRCLGGVREAWR